MDSANNGDNGLARSTGPVGKLHRFYGAVFTNSDITKEGFKIMTEVTTLSREFSYNGVKLPDPNPSMTIEEVRAIYANQYPDLATASIAGPETSDGKLHYSFVRAIGTKG